MDWKDIRRIVTYADRILERAIDNNWSEEEYYTRILERFNEKQEKK